MTKAGRPTKYKEEYIKEIEQYLQENIDFVDAVVESTNKQTGRKRYQRIQRVKLPTVEGFAKFIGVPRRTIYDWRDRHAEFSHTLDKILIEQQERLINKGLSGEYNSTIAKLILSSNHGMAERKDVTSGDLPIPLLNVLGNNSNKEDKETEEED